MSDDARRWRSSWRNRAWVFSPAITGRDGFPGLKNAPPLPPPREKYVRDDVKKASLRWKLALFKGVHLKRTIRPVGRDVGHGREEVTANPTVVTHRKEVPTGQRRD